MLNVRTITEVNSIIQNRFGDDRMSFESVPLESALDRVLAEDIKATKFVPDFNRSIVDGYAVKASDVFGCSYATPALLTLAGESIMGEHNDTQLIKGQCTFVPTGGEVPLYADAVVMLEDAEDFGDGSIAINNPYAPGTNMIFRGDDVKPGDSVIFAGKRLTVADIGALAALGIADVTVMKRPHAAIISTGDELVDVSGLLSVGKIHDVNAPMLCAAISDAGAEPWFCGIIKDDKQAIRIAMVEAIKDCDVLILSGGTSVGVKDVAPAVIAELGELMVHGVAAKPGKPTIVGSINDKPVFGLPGNPVAAYFMFHELVRPLIYSMLGEKPKERSVTVPLSRAVPSNHGREEFVPVSLRDGVAHPIAGKSGLITTLSCADGFIRIARDCEGLKQGETVDVTLFGR